MKIENFQSKYRTEDQESEKKSSSVPPVKTQQPSDIHRARPDASFKIKDSLRKISETQPLAKKEAVIEKKVVVELREPIDEEKVMAAFDKYIQEQKPEPTVAIALKTHRPEVRNEQICLAVDNQLQMEKLDALKVHLQNALMKTLKNGFLTLSFKMFDSKTSTEEKKLFTAGEKFQHFMQINPVVADLKSLFGLELD